MAIYEVHCYGVGDKEIGPFEVEADLVEVEGSFVVFSTVDGDIESNPVAIFSNQAFRHMLKKMATHA